MTITLPNEAYVKSNGTTSTSPFVEIFLPRDPTGYDNQYQLQKRWFNTITNQEFVLVGFTSFNGLNQAVWTSVASSLEFTGGTGTTGFPVFANSLGEIQISSNAGTIAITGSTNAINFDITGLSDAIETLTGNSGGAISPTAGNVNTLGSGSITIVGSGSTLTTELTGLTANSVLFGQGTTTIGKIAVVDNGVLVTSSLGVPSIGTTLPSLVQGNITSVGTLASGIVPTTLVKGSTSGSSPAVGYIGEQITANATNVSLSTGVALSVTSIVLTAGIWDISASCTVQAHSGALSQLQIGISTTTNTLTGTEGINYLTDNLTSNVLSMNAPLQRATLSGSVTYYLVVNSGFTGTGQVNGCLISATRVG
jgi:hypothetical protein